MPGSMSENHAFLIGCVIIGIVHIDADRVPDAVDEVFAERFAVQVFAVGVHVVESDGVERVRMRAQVIEA